MHKKTSASQDVLTASKCPHVPEHRGFVVYGYQVLRKGVQRLGHIGLYVVWGFRFAKQPSMENQVQKKNQVLWVKRLSLTCMCFRG